MRVLRFLRQAQIDDASVILIVIVAQTSFVCMNLVLPFLSFVKKF